MKETLRPAGTGSVSPILPALFLLFALWGCAQQYDPRDKAAPGSPPETGGPAADSLKGTVWVWDSPWGRRTLTFHPSEMTVSYLGQDGDNFTEAYTYDGGRKRGAVDYYGEAGFEISGDNRTMHFIEWKNYGHGCDYVRLDG
jgi:hypothetical protein